jgi:hypothetical protein
LQASGRKTVHRLCRGGRLANASQKMALATLIFELPAGHADFCSFEQIARADFFLNEQINERVK